MASLRALLLLLQRVWLPQSVVLVLWMVLDVPLLITVRLMVVDFMGR